MDIEKYIVGLSPELQEKARACGSVGELLELAKQEGVAIPDEALSSIAGGDGSEVGDCGDAPVCPKCGGKNIKISDDGAIRTYYLCEDCLYSWFTYDPRY